ncbi:MAG: outer membrane scaffolding protein for murein synthesis (MipA/OmpV family) [Oceanicoccus sp.]|jgi:outer membrane scaffolding protein for murein synthesis (MipA/OmpV family)
MLLFGFACGAPAFAEEKPLWEYGIGMAGLYHPHYLGADQQEGYALPLPYFTYRGKVFRADRGGMRGRIYESENFHLRLSISGSLPVNSDDSDAREGMDDLDVMLEVGPTLQYKLFESDRHQWRLDIPIRGGFTFGGTPFYHQGWTANPRIYHETDIGPWIVTSTLGPVFSDKRYHGYVYNVAEPFVTADRAFYQASSGYTATRFSTGLRRRFGDYFIGARLSYYNLNGAANEDSPLVKQDDYFGVNFVVAWVFGESERKVREAD